MKYPTIATSLFLLLSPIALQAAVYECVVNGKVVYTNKFKEGCHSASLSSIGSYTSDHRAYAKANSTPPPRRARTTRSTSGSRARSSEERISNNVQQQRDEGRLGILQRELTNEENALAAAQQQLRENRAAKKGESADAHQNRLQTLQGAVQDRQENINAIKKEISRI